MVDLQNRKLANGSRDAGLHARARFLGPLAFIGLSQVRETAVFSGVPLAERPHRAELRGVGRPP